MKAILVNYNYTPDWLFEYPELDYHIYDRSDSKEYLEKFPQERITYTKNIGNVDFDKLSYLVEQYDTLPDVFLWGKSNLFKYISRTEFDAVKNTNTFTPLIAQSHRTYGDKFGTICYYEEGVYHERNDSWYLESVPAKYVSSFNEWANLFGMPQPDYIPFAPGGNYILTKETVQKYSRDFYSNMMAMLPYCQLPGEAQCAERSYYLLWK